MSLTEQQKGRKTDSATRPGAPKGTGQAKMPPRRTWLWFVLVLVANFFLVRLLMPGAEAPVTVPYTLFKEEVAKGNVQAIYSQGDTITGRFKAPVTYPPASEKSAAPGGDGSQADERARCNAPRRAQGGDDVHDHAALLRRPRARSVPDRHTASRSAPNRSRKAAAPGRRCSSGSARRCSSSGSTSGCSGGRQQGGGMGGGLMGIGKSKARRYDQEQDTKVTFDDVAGIDEAENELVEIVDFLKDPPEVHAPGRDRAEGRAAGRRAGHRARPCWRRRSRERRGCRSSR